MARGKHAAVAERRREEMSRAVMEDQRVEIRCLKAQVREGQESLLRVSGLQKEVERLREQVQVGASDEVLRLRQTVTDQRQRLRVLEDQVTRIRKHWHVSMTKVLPRLTNKDESTIQAFEKLGEALSEAEVTISLGVDKSPASADSVAVRRIQKARRVRSTGG